MLYRMLRDRARTLCRPGCLLFAFLLAAVVAWPQTPHAITVNWTYAQGTDPAVGFFVFRSTTSGGPYTMLNSIALPVTQLTYADTTGTAGTKYFYVVAAADANGSLSANSAEASAIFLANPAAPQGVTATAK